jgi:hypothetical protein
MKHLMTALFLLLPAIASADPRSAPAGAAGGPCLPAIAAAERSEGLPAHLLRSIAFVESGRPDPATGRIVPWPWTINVAGTGYFHASKEEAIAAVRLFQASGIRSIDIGCAQVNLLHHPDAFASLDSAFDPQTNANYAARFLKALHRASGSWPLAAAAYHSQTPDIGYGYARKVMAIWPNADRYGALPAPGRGAASRPAVDYSIYTPEFATRLRRMDQDLARGMPAGSATGLVWINRPAEPVPVAPPGPRRPARRDHRRAPG